MDVMIADSYIRKIKNPVIRITAAARRNCKAYFFSSRQRDAKSAKENQEIFVLFFAAVDPLCERFYAFIHRLHFYGITFYLEV